VGPDLHNANRYYSVEGQPIVVSPLRATLVDNRPSCRDAILDAIARLQARTGSTEFTRRDIVTEVQATDATFERQSVYRSLRRMAGREPGSAYHDLWDLGGNRLQLRA
jgi:hypothetical protein